MDGLISLNLRINYGLACSIDEYIFKNKQVPLWLELDKGIKLPKGSIEKLIGKKLNWRDEPVELK